MKKRLVAFLLAVSIAVSMLMIPASASGSNAAVQSAVTLGALTTEQTASLGTAVTRGQFAKMLVEFSTYRTSVGSQGSTGTLFSDVAGSDSLAPYIRIAVQQGWMSGYTDGSFRPNNGMTLEEVCTSVLKLLGYDITALNGTFPTAQLTKASALGLRDNLTAQQGSGMTLEDCAVLLYNALTATTNEGQVYASTLGFTVSSNGQVDLSSIMTGVRQGPFVASAGSTLPFTPSTIYRNDSLAASAELAAYDVYYYNADTQTVWIYTRKAAGRVTAVSPSASAPASVTVAGVEYSIATTEAAATLSSLNGGGVGQVVTLLLGLNNEVVRVLTGTQAEEVYYGVVQSSERSLVEENGADVLQAVTVACTDGVTRTVNVDKDLNFPAGWLVKVTVDGNGENVETIESQSTTGTFNADGTALGDTALASDVEILDTTSEGLAGTISPSRLSGVTLSGSDVRYYTTNASGQIDRLVLNDVTGDLWTYGVLNDVKNAINNLTDESSSAGNGATSTGTTTSAIVSDVSDILLPTTSELLWGIIDGNIVSTVWSNLTSNTSQLASYALKLLANNTSGTLSSVLNYLGSGARYQCFVNGKETTYTTSVKYAVVAGGIAVGETTNGTVGSMVQLMPTVIDKLGAASAMSGDTRYEMADNMQVYLWYKGQYFATTLSQVNADDYHLIGWYDNFGCSGGKKIRVLIAVKNDS